jgi:hypothetical protein
MTAMGLSVVRRQPPRCGPPSIIVDHYLTPLRVAGHRAVQGCLLKLANGPKWPPSRCECVGMSMGAKKGAAFIVAAD